MFRRVPSRVRNCSLFFNSRQNMASTNAAQDPIKKLFADKIREFRAANKGLDEAHQKLQSEEMVRLSRVYKIENEAKLVDLSHKFDDQVNVTLRDLDENKEFREALASGKYQAQLSEQQAKPSELLASIPDQTQHEYHLPPNNKPSELLLMNNDVMVAPTLGGERPDYEYVGGKMTPKKLEEDLLVQFGENMPTIDDDKAPGRDVVNFPRLPIREHCPPTRAHFIPESWFQFFHPATGISGPYVFAGSFLTFLLSKEWLVWEHELLTGVSTTIIFSYLTIKYGPKISSYFRNSLKADLDGWENWRKGNIELLKGMSQHYQNQLKSSDTIREIYAAREEDVSLQLEKAYRERLSVIYQNTKRRLDYLVAKADAERQIHHKNLVNYIVTQAQKSFGPAQENEVIDSCIRDLKELAVKHPNAV